MGLLDKAVALIGGATSTTAGGILDGITKTANSLFNTEEDKQKSEQFAAQCKQAIQEQLDKHNETIAALAEQQYQSALSDIQSARQMETAIQEAKEGAWLSKNIVPILAIFVSLVWGGVTGYLLFRIMGIIAATPNVNMTALMGFYSALTASQTIVLSFYFGSSSSSQKKDDTIAVIAKQP